MGKSSIIERVKLDCPLCDQNHYVEKRSRIANIIIKGEKTFYNEEYYLCSNCSDGENEFVTGKMENDNLLNARNSYRKQHGLLTSKEIVEIRELYGMSQVDMAKLLGWGEATISRYESKAIQDESHDSILRMLRKYPLLAIDYVGRNRMKFTTQKVRNISEHVMDVLATYGLEEFGRINLACDYLIYREPCDENGYCELNIDKTEAIISYYAKRIPNLHKTKLMNMLWIADIMNYKDVNHSLTGLVYRRDTAGVLPIGHYKLMGLENVHLIEEYEFGYVKYCTLPNAQIDESVLSSAEIQLLNAVINGFQTTEEKDVVERISSEISQKGIMEQDIIPFSVTTDIAFM